MNIELNRDEIPNHLMRFFEPVPTLKSKDLGMLPARVAIALQDDGWYLRSEIVWHKPNVMPESVTDRPTKAHEMVYLLTKCPEYWYDADAIREPQSNWIETRKPYQIKGNSDRNDKGQPPQSANLIGRNKRDVWTVNSEPFAGAHFATFPSKLIEPMILAGCPDKACGKCGKPWKRCVEDTPEYAEIKRSMLGKTHTVDNPLQYGMGQSYGKDKARVTKSQITTGFEPTCNCNADTRPGIVLDPFFGSGTTGLVARANGRHFIGCDLNPEYVKLARERLRLPFEAHHMTHDSEVADLPLFAAP